MKDIGRTSPVNRTTSEDEPRACSPQSLFRIDGPETKKACFPLGKQASLPLRANLRTASYVPASGLRRANREAMAGVVTSSPRYACFCPWMLLPPIAHDVTGKASARHCDIG